MIITVRPLLYNDLCFGMLHPDIQFFVQYSGPYKDAIAYVTWLKGDHRFSDILVQISLSFSGHAFPKLKMRYKPSLVQASFI